MSRSEIFDEYAKLAEKMGLISTAEEEASSSTNKTRQEMSTIEALYGVKADGDSDEHIMQQAHPKPVVIAPSYDKINGLVENNIERQNIIVNLIGAPPTGIVNQKKLAERELTLALIRAANDMDNRGNDELRVLADECLEGLKKKSSKIEKNAWIVPAAVGAAAVLSALWLYNNLNDSDQGLLGNIDNAIEKINSFLNDNGEGWTGKFFWGTLGKEAQINLAKLRVDLDKLRIAVIEFNKIKNDLYQPRTLQELKSLGEDKARIAVSKMEQFKENLLNIRPEIATTIANYDNTDYKINNLDQSTLSKMFGTVGNWVGSNFFATDQFKKIKNALGTTLESIDSAIEFITKTLPNYQAEIQRRISEVPAFMQPKVPAGQPTLPDMPSAPTETPNPHQEVPNDSKPEEEWDLSGFDNT